MRPARRLPCAVPRALGLAAALWLAQPAPASAADAWAADAPEALRCAETRITAEIEGRTVGFEIEIADEPAEQARGLMFRPSLPEGTGMLFVYPEPRIARFWMKNTMIPLDMIFIDDAGAVVNVAARTVPYSLEVRSSDAPVRAVLEINGGRAEALGIGPGTRFVHPAFRAAPPGFLCPSD